MSDPGAAQDGPSPPMAFHPQMLAGISEIGHVGYLGLRYHAHGPDWIEMALPWREDLIGLPDSQVLASGPIISLLDTTTSLAVNVRRGAFLPVATIDLRIDYMRPARPGAVVLARGECYKLTRSIAFVRGIAHEGDTADPIAHVAGSFMLMDAPPRESAA
jgi:uncharacterized protein (TIGR00369 family)